MKNIKAWAAKLDALASADKSAPGAESLPPDVKVLMLKLAGADIFPDPNSRTWFGKLKGVLKVFAGDKPVGALVSYVSVYDKPRRPGLVDDVRDNYRYAGLRVGGRGAGTGCLILTLAIPDEKQKDIRIDVPLAEGQATEIYLYKEDPGLGNLEKPDAKITLPGPWSLFRQIACDNGEAEHDEKTGQWKVLTTTPDGKMYLWVYLKVQEQTLPLKTDWPQIDQWPTP